MTDLKRALEWNEQPRDGLFRVVVTYMSVFHRKAAFFLYFKDRQGTTSGGIGCERVWSVQHLTGPTAGQHDGLQLHQCHLLQKPRGSSRPPAPPEQLCTKWALPLVWREGCCISTACRYPASRFPVRQIKVMALHSFESWWFPLAKCDMEARQAPS